MSLTSSASHPQRSSTDAHLSPPLQVRGQSERLFVASLHRFEVVAAGGRGRPTWCPSMRTISRRPGQTHRSRGSQNRDDDIDYAGTSPVQMSTG